MTRHRTSIAVPVLVAAAGVSTGCANDFAPFNRLASLRVLAIQSEPVAPGPDETAVLTPLVYAPPGDSEVTYAWSWCPFVGSPGDGFPCLLEEAQLAMLAGDGVAVPSYDLGSEPTAALENTLTPAVLERLCAGTPGVPVLPDCSAGFPVQVRLTVTTAKEEVVAVRTLRLRLTPDSEANGNPHIDGLFANVGDADQPVTDAAAVVLPRQEETVIKVEVPQDAAETYQRGASSPARERLVLTWLVEGGDTSSDHTSFIDGATPLDRALETRWELPAIAEYARDRAQLIVVLRDDRGGVAWRAGTVALGDAP